MNYTNYILLAALAGVWLYKTKPTIVGDSILNQVTEKSRGYRNKNPGNLRDFKIGWKGEAGADADGYLIFKTDHYGIRAAARNLLNYERLHGIKDIAGIISRWAPQKDNNETAAYIAHVSRQVNVPAYMPINVEAMAPAILREIFYFENGYHKYTDSQIKAGVEAAF